MFDNLLPDLGKTIKEAWQNIKPFEIKETDEESGNVGDMFDKRLIVKKRAKFWDVLRAMKTRGKDLVVLDNDGDMWQIKLLVKHPEEVKDAKKK